MNLSELKLDRYLYRDNSQDSETKDSTFVSADSSEQEATPIYSGGAAQDINTGNVQIDGGQLEPGTYPVTVLDVSNWGWGQSCVFSSDDNNTVSWAGGTFTSASGEDYTIGVGDTGNMGVAPEITYIYLDLNVSEIAYQTTTTSADSVGIGKVLIAVAKIGLTGADDATYNLSEATQIIGDNILANTIDASKITAGQLVVGTNIGIGTAFATADAGDLATLDLVETAQLGTTVIVGGYIKTSLLTADNIIAGTLTGITITGNTIRTSASGLRVEMTSTDTNKISFYNSAALYGELEVSYTSPKGFISLLTQDGNGLTLDTDIAVSGYNASALKSNGGTFDTYGNATNRMIMMDGSAGSGTSMFGIQYTSGTFRLITDLRLQSDWLPYATATQDLGSVSYKWQDLHLNNDFVYRTKHQPVMYTNYVSGTTLSKGNSGFSVTNSSTGVYVVTHSFGLTNYTVQVTPYAASGGGAPSAKISSIATNSFTVITYDDTGTAAAFDFQFMLLLNT